MHSTHGRIFVMGLGAQKAATSWLADQLDRHPQFLLSPIKEIHYWDRRFLPHFFKKNNIEKKISKFLRTNHSAALSSPLIELYLMNRHELFYRTFFESRLEPMHKAFGEFSPSYCFLLAEHLEYIRKFMNYRMKVIFIMRDPVSRLWSQCKMEYLKSTNRGRTLDPVYVFENHFKADKYWKRSDYRHTIEAVDRVFSEEDKKFLFFEELFAPSTAADICKFLEIENISFKPSVNPNEGVPLPKPPLMSWQRVQEAYKPIYEYVERRMCYLPSEWALMDD